jgi:molybdopterin-guanine dinucleotide biosynthesis protein B
VCRLLRQLTAQGITVATVKHAHHGFDLLPPDHPAQAWRAAGATDIVLETPSRWAHLHELAGEPEPRLDSLLESLDPVDLVLIEGYKRGGHEKIEVYRGTKEGPLLAMDDPTIVAIASAVPLTPDRLPARALPVFDLDNVVEMAAFVVSHCGLAKTT